MTRDPIDAVEAKLSVHEAVCAERYGNLMERLRRVEMVVWAAIGALLVTMLALLTHKVFGV